MPGRISKPFVDELLARVDIIDVVGQAVPLKKSGKDFQGLCPFHTEKTPSFTVSQDKQFYHCFGCGAHGSALGFVMNNRGLSFVEAVEELASIAGLQVVYEDGERPASQDLSGLFNILEQTQRLYARLLREHSTKARAVDYLKKRGLSGAVAKQFGIGYAPAAWDTVVTALGKTSRDTKLLEDAGLILKKDQGGHYDRFRDRVMFPIHDRRGRVVGFGGRIIDKGEPKYLNSPETPIFRKRQELYGLHLLKQQRPAAQSALVVEGYMDVVALAQYGVNGAVATLGTATTREQLEQLFRVVPEIIFCFDGDNAGRRAAWRALETVMPALVEGRKVGFLFMPQGEDPDSLVRTQGSAMFRDPAAITSLSELLFRELRSQADVKTLDGRAQLIALARPLITKVPEGPFRQLLEEHLAEMAQTTSVANLWSRSVERPQKPAFKPPKAPSRRVKTVLVKALSYLLKRPELALTVIDLPIQEITDSEETNLFLKVIGLYRDHPTLSIGAMLEYLRDEPEAELLSDALGLPVLLAEELWEEEFRGAVEHALRQSKRNFHQRIVGDEPAAPSALPSPQRDQLRTGRVIKPK